MKPIAVTNRSKQMVPERLPDSWSAHDVTPPPPSCVTDLAPERDAAGRRPLGHRDLPGVRDVTTHHPRSETPRLGNLHLRTGKRRKGARSSARH